MMMTFPHRGAFVVRAAESLAVIDLNSTFLIQPQSPYWMSGHPGLRSRGAYVLIRPDVFLSVWGEAGTKRGSAISGGLQVRVRTTAGSYLLQRLILEAAVRQPSCGSVEINRLGIALLTSAARSRNSAEEVSEADGRTGELVERIRLFFAEKPSSARRLDEIAASVGLSRYYICRLFKGATGLSLHRYQLSLRLRAALDHVVYPSADLGEISMRFGFSSPSHFSAAFRREFGVAPSQIRRTTGRRLLGDSLATRDLPYQL